MTLDNHLPNRSLPNEDEKYEDSSDDVQTTNDAQKYLKTIKYGVKAHACVFH
jgi:hypothetical protein